MANGRYPEASHLGLRERDPLAISKQNSSRVAQVTPKLKICTTSMQELRLTQIPDHSGYVGAPPQSSSLLACSIRQSKITHRTAGASPAKAQWPNSKAAFQRKVSHPFIGFHTHTIAVRVSHPFRCIRVSHPHRRSQGFTPAPLHSGFTPTHRVSHPFTGFHTHSNAVRVSHPFRYTPGFTPTPPQSGFHTRSAAFGFYTQGFTPIHRVSHPHHPSQGFTPVPLHSGFTPTPPQSRFHTRSAAFRFHTHTPGFTPTPPHEGFTPVPLHTGFDTHTTAVKVSHLFHCIRVSHPFTGFHTHTTAVRVSHPFRCIRVSHPHRFTPASRHSGFTPTHRVSHPHHRSQGFTAVPLHSGLGTFGSAHGHLDLPLRSPTNPVSHRAVAGASMPTRFPETAATAPLSGRSTRSSKPSLATLKAASLTLFLLQRG
ncbi:hypothetical protein CRG98_016875 [Punica granatum]|uniref:Uncharacterized protein n=1 Tax=Punica granatum TaxID=22663 RepID=A0A2I0K3K9_PUNGR|nr:hypothetical protein CRG98_016875 [Punica granatum]